MPETIAAHALITGRVQGVFYRAGTQREAERLGLAGWVRNLPGGQVEAHFEGARAHVETMLTWCEHGPPAAQVTLVETEWTQPEGFSSFEVRY